VGLLVSTKWINKDIAVRRFSAGAYVTDLGSRKNFVLIFGHRYRYVLTIDGKWKIDVAIFSLEP